jgi:hypothetical protein
LHTIHANIQNFIANGGRGSLAKADGLFAQKQEYSDSDEYR